MEPHFRVLSNQLDAITISAMHFLNLEAPQSKDKAIRWLGNQFNIMITMSSYDSLRTAFFGTPQPDIIIKFEPIPKGFVKSSLGEGKVDHISKFMQAQIASLTLLSFYQEFIGDVADYNKKSGKEPDPVWAFARVVRNAIAHQQINLTDKNFKPVTWHSLTYGLEQNGRAIIGTDLNVSDLITLMVEMDLRLMNMGINGERVNQLIRAGG